MQNRRVHQRFDAAVAAEITVQGETHEAQTRDVSEGGVSALLDAVLEENATVIVALILTQDGIEDPTEEPVELNARVIWTAPRDEGGSMAGLRFVNITPAQQKELDRFLKAIG